MKEALSDPPPPIAFLAAALVQDLFDHLPDAPFFLKDRALRYAAANQAMLDLCGIPRLEDLIGKTAADVFPGPFGRRYEALDRQVLATGASVRNQLDLSTDRAGRPIWLLFARLPVRSPDGEIVGVAAASRRLQAPDRRHPIYSRLAAAVERLQTHLAEPLDLGALAQACGVSSSQLERDFRALFGVSPGRYLAILRIDAALALLAGEAPIAEIALTCGYTDQSAFSRRFKAIVGLSPGAYRRKAGKKP